MIFQSLYFSTLQAPFNWPDKCLWYLLGNKSLAIEVKVTVHFLWGCKGGREPGDEMIICFCFLGDEMCLLRNAVHRPAPHPLGIPAQVSGGSETVQRME